MGTGKIKDLLYNLNKKELKEIKREVERQIFLRG